MARWAQEAYRISERRAARLVQLAIGTLRYQSRKVFDEVLETDGAAATRRLAREREAHLPLVPGGRFDIISGFWVV